MRLLKRNTLLGLVNSYVVDSPQPANLSYAWNGGSLLATCLGIQIVTGVILAMHYTPNVDLAFVSVEHIMRDVNYGWMIRYIHANVASFFFIFVYLHIGRGLYYGSYKSPRSITWSIGVIILVLMMAIAFLGYVLPYGQMSLWGATVITNMLSAIPWIGQDFVQLNSIYIVFLSILLLLSAVSIVYNMSTISDPLPTIGTINWKAMRNAQPLSPQEKEKLLLIPYSFLAMLVGLIDGDGYLKVVKSCTGFLQVEMVLSLELKDLALIQHIHSVLGFGRVLINEKANVAKYIMGRADLQQAFFPLLLHHCIYFLTATRRDQFNKMMAVFTMNITRFADLPSVYPSFNPLPVTALGFVRLPFFADWTVGFTMAEGSFHVKASGEFFFSLRQRNEGHIELFQAFLLLFNTQRKIENDGKYLKFSVSSVSDLSTVVNFFSFSGNHPLLGLKGLQYQNWILNMKSVKRFANIPLP